MNKLISQSVSFEMGGRWKDRGKTDSWQRDDSLESCFMKPCENRSISFTWRLTINNTMFYEQFCYLKNGLHIYLSRRCYHAAEVLSRCDSLPIPVASGVSWRLHVCCRSEIVFVHHKTHLSVDVGWMLCLSLIFHISFFHSIFV